MRLTASFKQPQSAWWKLVPVLLIITVIYSRVLGHEFVWDDYDFIVNWQALRAFPGNWSELLAGAVPADHDHTFRPLRSIYYGMAFLMYGLEPFWYHLQTIVVHLVGVMAVMILAGHFCGDWKALGVIGLVFGLHPANTEPVAWITSNFDTIGLVWMLLCLNSYLRYQVTQKRYWLQVSWLLTWLANFSYELTLTLPLLILSYDWWVKGQVKPWRHYWPFVLPNLAYWLIRLGWLGTDNGKRLLFSDLGELIRGVSLLASYYLEQAILPLTSTVNRALEVYKSAFFYNDLTLHAGLIPVPSWTHPRVLLSLGISLAVLALLLHLRQSRPIWIWGVISFGLSLLPILQVFPQAVIFAERYLYLGLALFLASLAPMVSYALNNYTRVSLLGFSLVICSFSWLTWNRLGEWHDDLSLWQAALADNPASPSMYQNYGDALYRTGETKAAVKIFLAGLRLNPQHPGLLENIAHGYASLEKWPAAIRYYSQLLQIEDRRELARVKLGDIALVQDDWIQARFHYQPLAVYPNPYQDYAQKKLLLIQSQLDQSEPAKN